MLIKVEALDFLLKILRKDIAIFLQAKFSLPPNRQHFCSRNDSRALVSSYAFLAFHCMRGFLYKTVSTAILPACFQCPTFHSATLASSARISNS